MKYVVIKCGGSVLEALPDSFYSDIVQLHEDGDWMPVIVHGGGPLINSLVKKLGVDTHFVKGLRVTSKEMLDIVEMVLSGHVNKKVVRKLFQANGKAFGISGVDGGLLKTKMIDAHLGFVGEVMSVNESIIRNMCHQGYIPVISPLGMDESGQHYNVNGDVAASAIAKVLEARLCFVSDIPGIMIEEKNEKKVLHNVSKQEAEDLITQGIITGGMIPKIKAAIDGLEHQIPEVVILNGLEENNLIHFCNGKSIGTRITLNQEVKSGV